jgi:hypothetical protein
LSWTALTQVIHFGSFWEHPEIFEQL